MLRLRRISAAEPSWLPHGTATSAFGVTPVTVSCADQRRFPACLPAFFFAGPRLPFFASSSRRT